MQIVCGDQLGIGHGLSSLLFRVGVVVFGVLAFSHLAKHLETESRHG